MKYLLILLASLFLANCKKKDDTPECAKEGYSTIIVTNTDTVAYYVGQYYLGEPLVNTTRIGPDSSADVRVKATGTIELKGDDLKGGARYTYPFICYPCENRSWKILRDTVYAQVK